MVVVVHVDVNSGERGPLNLREKKMMMIRGQERRAREIRFLIQNDSLQNNRD